MCGRFSQFSSVNDLVAQFSVDETLVDPDEVRPRYNVAPTQQVLVIATSSDGSVRQLGSMRWGLVPSWAKDPSIGNRMINARAEKVATSGAFRSAFKSRRCIVPATGFYEWRKPHLAPEGAPDRKQPFHIHAADGAPLALAGLWESWHDAEDRPMHSCTIITTEPNETMASVHDRMPVILPAAAWDRWLDPVALDGAEQDRLLRSAPDDLLVLDAVSTRVNNARNEGADLIDPIDAT